MKTLKTCGVCGTTRNLEIALKCPICEMEADNKKRIEKGKRLKKLKSQPPCRHASTSVIDSRQKDGVIRRRRECEVCKVRFSTLEYLGESVDLLREAERKLTSLEGKLEKIKQIF